MHIPTNRIAAALRAADTIRPTQAVDLGNGTYRLLPTPNYDPEDEIWEFPPGTVVKCKITNDYRDKNVLLAFEEVPRI